VTPAPPDTQHGGNGWRRPGVAAWIAGLLTIYVAFSVIGWRRTLINDEIWHLINAALPFDQFLATLRLDLTHPPLMYVLDRQVMNAFGHTDTVVKTMVVMLGASSLAAFTVLSSLVVDRWRLASALFGTAYLQLGGVPNLARGYSLGLLLTVVALLFWELWRRRPRTLLLVSWAAVMIALVYTHYVGILLLLPFVIANWWYGHRPWLFAIVACAVAASFLPWFFAVLPVYLSRGLGENLGWITLSPPVILATLPFHVLTYLPSGWNPLGENDWPRSLAGKQVLVIGALAVHAMLGVLVWRRSHGLWPPTADRATRRVWLWSALLFIVIPTLALFLFSVSVHPTLDARFVAFVLPLYWLLVALAVELGGPPVRRVVYLVVVPWVLVSVAVPLARVVKGGLHQSVAGVAREIRPGDLVLAERLAGPQVYWEWTRALARNEPIVIVSHLRPLNTPRELPLRRLDEVNLRATDRVWFFWTRHNPDNIAEIRAYIVNHGFREARQHSAAYLTVFDRQR
jgi:hypothetical protein